MKFTSSQQQVLAELPKWFYSGSDIATLEAPGGYGKSFLLRYFLDSMGRRCQPLILAETNEATNVLRESLGANYLDKTKTVCSAFNLSLGNVEGVVQLQQRRMPEFTGVNILLIDEASMLSRERLCLIIDTCTEFNMKLLLIGHSSQLCSINERDATGSCESPAFVDQFYLDNGYEVPSKFFLKEPVRNTTGIHTFCMDVEKLLTQRGVVDSRYKVPSTYLKKYLETPEGIQHFFDGTTNVIAYSNLRVKEHNESIRKGLFGEDAIENLFLINDRLIFRQPTRCFVKQLPNYTKSVQTILKSKNIVFTTNTRAVVLDVTFKEVHDILCWELKVASNHFELGNRVGYVYHPITRSEVCALFHKYINFALWDKEGKRQAKFDLAHAIPGLFGVDCGEGKYDLKHSYALTVDCAQGSTIDNVVVDESNINKCVSNRKLLIKVLYVAFSRARHNLWRM